MKNNFNSNHLRAIGSVIHVAAEYLEAMEELLAYAKLPQEKTGVIMLSDDLTTDQHEAVIAQLNLTKTALQNFSRFYAIDKETQSLNKLLNIKAVRLWEDLSGAEFERLIGYGPTDENDRAGYHSFLQPLIELSQQLIQITNP
ncbi:hypothetical protein HH214_09255 [Mucilaginibacter robiniae]|uniref:Uncharacterized protein n=1 Tax=Mucilaginibacter robiniae TaxID=2728022 RepID=A0A7L5E178_9SPHI|nr:hypothetical protein [Mucilaginibacter robiniae]QJD96049.1 hypothetical protein HH214_09255 [Mucilaginibacter robiniae]